MILDSYKLRQLIFQIRYPDAFELWDRAGAVARSLAKTWPELKVIEGKPNHQMLQAPGVEVQVSLGMSTVTLKGLDSLESAKPLVASAFSAWRDELALEVADRVSTRAIYSKVFSSIKAANEELFSLGLTKWPSQKVFDQPIDSDLNTVDLGYKFEDESSFAFLRVYSERITYNLEHDREYTEAPGVEEIICRLNIDFDRGLLGTVKLSSFRTEDWIRVLDIFFAET